MFSYKSAIPFQNNFEKPIKIQNKTTLEQNVLINEIDLYDDDDPIEKEIPRNKKSLFTESFFLELLSNVYSDPHPKHELVQNIISSPTINTNPNTQSSVTPT